MDGNGSIVGVTNRTGKVTSTYSYDPWGTCTSSSCPPTNSFGFDGGFLSQSGLYHFGERYYDPNTGSWTQPDPAGPSGDPTLTDPYVFAGDDPVNSVDPSGLFRTDCGEPQSLGGGLLVQFCHADFSKWWTRVINTTLNTKAGAALRAALSYAVCAQLARHGLGALTCALLLSQLGPDRIAAEAKKAANAGHCLSIQYNVYINEFSGGKVYWPTGVTTDSGSSCQ
jgi:RHS repeat-associated protein